MISSINKEKFNDYDGFVEKFKEKKTTDDCYTPKEVYEIVKDFAVNEYNLQDKEILRPFYPGNDYTKFNYTDNTVVIDNPPFSILAEILKFYVDNNIKFFLFAPALTCFSNKNPNINHIITNTKIVYENGAAVKTSFITNMDKYRIRTVSKLSHKINELKNENKISLPKYNYPDNLVTASRLHKLIDSHIDICISNDECYFTRQLDEQKPIKKTIFGAGFLISNSKLKELKEKEKIELKKESMIKNNVYTFNLSEKEKEIVDSLL